MIMERKGEYEQCLIHSFSEGILTPIKVMPWQQKQYNISIVGSGYICITGTLLYSTSHPARVHIWNVD